MACWSKTFVSVMALGIAAPFLPTSWLSQPRAAQVREELDVLWADLGSADELTAGRALLKFAGRPADAVNYLKKKLPPLVLSKKRAKQLLADLGGNDENAARAAFDEFSYFDPRLALNQEELAGALVGRPTSRRLGALLLDLPADALWRESYHFNSPDNVVFRFNHGREIVDRDVAISVGDVGTHGRKLSWVRAVRAVALLEQIGTPGGMEILKGLAKGHPDAAPTKAAKIALKKLE